ncbi:uncharacterized, partial [Tachysurus ichikawai]
AVAVRWVLLARDMLPSIPPLIRSPSVSYMAILHGPVICTLLDSGLLFLHGPGTQLR